MSGSCVTDNFPGGIETINAQMSADLDDLSITYKHTVNGSPEKITYGNTEVRNSEDMYA